jgi:ribosomal protein S18 acetylase RimI-like enzyme
VKAHDDLEDPDHAGDACGCGHDHGDGEHAGPELEINVRPFRGEDYRELKAIWKSGEIVIDESDSLKALKENLTRRKNGFQLFVAEARAVDPHNGKSLSKGRIAGGVILTYDGHRAYIYHFAVHPDFRGVGLGQALLDCCEDQARAWGAKHLRLMSRTDPARAGARRLYAKAGWTRDDSLCQFKKELE